jgi:uncharacterized protein (DUF1697 family)
MPVLRAALDAAGFGNVRTYLQSGNVLADGEPEAVVAAIRAVIDVPCVVRSAGELEAAVAANPFPQEALANPRALQVTFRAAPADSGTLSALQARVTGGEQVAIHGREIYTWHPEGIAHSKLALAVTPPRAAVTARNWNTVLALAELARA